MMNTSRGDCYVHPTHTESLLSEILCHLPYGIFSVALSFIIIGFVQGFSSEHALHEVAHRLFHSFHFLHIVFAATGSYLGFMRFSKRVFFSAFLSLLSATVFCTLSDIILPYSAGLAFGVDMDLHLCIVSEIHNVLIFWFIGFINGLVIMRNNSLGNSAFVVVSHFAHILTSALASLFYLVAEGFTTWYDHMGMLFVLLIFAVVIPCTFSDVIMPVVFGKIGKRYEKHSS